MIFEIGFHGHQNIRATHRRTVEITREERLSTDGDCIVGVGAACGCSGLPDALKGRLRDPAARIKISIMAGPHTFETVGSGHPDLSLSHEDDIVVRMSGFTSSRTLAVSCKRAADSIPRQMVRLLQNPLQRGVLRIETD